MTFDASGTGTISGANSVLTFSQTCTGSNRGLYVGVSTVDTAYTTNTFSVTYNGVSMTQIYQRVATGQNNRRHGLFHLENPATGTNNVVVTCSTNVSNNIIGVSSSYASVAQSGQPDSNNVVDAASSTSVTTSTTVVASNCWLVGVSSQDTGTSPTGGTNATFRNSAVGNQCIAIWDSNGAVGTGSQSMTVNEGATGDATLMLVSVAPFVAVATTTYKSLLGVGR